MSRSCRFYCTLIGISRISSIPSAAGWGSSIGTTSDADTKCGRPSEDSDLLPPLEELFDKFQEDLAEGDGCIDRLGELADTLWREVIAEVEANSTQSNEQIPIKEETSRVSAVVDQAPGIVEIDAGSKSMSHAPQPAPVPNSCISELTAEQVPAENISLQDVKVKREPATDMDTVYGTYDEATNCITIIYSGEDDDVQIEESVQEVSTEILQTQNDEPMSLIPVHTYADHLSPYTCQDSMSPSSFHSDDTDSSIPISKRDSNFSDKGYESHDSPFDDTGSVHETSLLTDLWQESFSELFPSLA